MFVTLSELADLFSSTIRAKLPRFAAGISDTNFNRLLLFLRAVNWIGKPVLLCVDDTKVHRSLRPYHDGADDRWKLAGVHGRVPEFESYDELSKLVKDEQNNKAEKVSQSILLH